MSMGVCLFVCSFVCMVFNSTSAQIGYILVSRIGEYRSGTIQQNSKITMNHEVKVREFGNFVDGYVKYGEKG